MPWPPRGRLTLDAPGGSPLGAGTSLRAHASGSWRPLPVPRPWESAKLSRAHAHNCLVYYKEDGLFLVALNSQKTPAPQAQHRSGTFLEPKLRKSKVERKREIRFTALSYAHYAKMRSAFSKTSGATVQVMRTPSTSMIT